MSIQIILLAGHAGAGKSLLASRLAERHGYTRLSFATPLKALEAEAYKTWVDASANLRRNSPCFFVPCARFLIYLEEFLNPDRLISDFDHSRKLAVDLMDAILSFYARNVLTDKKHRNALQFIGTDVFRNTVSKMFWVNIAIEKIRDAVNSQRGRPDHFFVFDDVRFPEELQIDPRIDACPAVTTSIYLIRTDQPPAADEHESETAIAPTDCEHVIEHATVAELMKKAERILWMTGLGDMK